jgi:hypothetical protein
MPMLGHAPVAHLVDVDAGDRELRAVGGTPMKLPLWVPVWLQRTTTRPPSATSPRW